MAVSDPDPEAAERGGKEHGRKIRREEHVGPDLGQSPPRQGRQSETADGKASAESGEGWEIPCQPRLNSSINFVIGIVTSRDQRIQNKAEV